MTEEGEDVRLEEKRKAVTLELKEKEDEDLRLEEKRKAVTLELKEKEDEDEDSRRERQKAVRFEVKEKEDEDARLETATMSESKKEKMEAREMLRKTTRHYPCMTKGGALKIIP